MPRKYKPKENAKQYKKYDQETIKQALEELKSRNATIRSVAEKYNISRSVIQRHSTKEMKAPGGQTALSIEAEEYIVKNVNTCAEWGYPLDGTDLRFLVKGYLDMLGITHRRFKNNLPGRDFVYNFLERHKHNMSQRLCQNIKRARASISPSIINTYFSELKKSLDGVPLGNIVNYDETNLSDDPGRHKILVKRGCKYPERIVNHSKASVSLMMAGTAEGVLLPPYVVYKSTNLYDTWVKNGPLHARYNRTSSGWFDSEVFKDWVKQVVIPFFKKKEGKKILLGDNLSTHLSMDLIDLCKNNDIHFIFLPANSTHLTQPLDVAFFRPMKIAWRQILLKWKKSDGRSLSSVPKGCFPKMLKLLMDQIQINSMDNLRAGFRKTGISPFNPNEVLARLPEEAQNDEQIKDVIDKSVLNLLKEMRYGSNIVEPKKKRKIDVIAGRSVSHNDVESYPESAEKDIANENKEKQKPNQPQKSLKGKGVGKKTKICDKKENKPPSPVAHCSYEADLTVDKTDNSLLPDKEKQHSDWSDIDLDKMPVVLSEDLKIYKEIIIPYECKELTEINISEETNLIEIENAQASLNSDGVRPRAIEEFYEQDKPNEKTNLTDVANVIITSNTKISQEQLAKLIPKNPRKQKMKPVPVNKKINITKKTKFPRIEKNYYGDTDEILKILQED